MLSGFGFTVGLGTLLSGHLMCRVLGQGNIALSLSKDSYCKAVGPKGHTISGFWAILSLRVEFHSSFRVA